MRFFITGIALFFLAVAPASARTPQDDKMARVAGDALLWHMANGRSRQAFEAMPKGGDIHTHLRGAIYAESWLEWAAEDGLCADMSQVAIVFPEEASCEDSGWVDAATAQADDGMRLQLINGLSTRNYFPTNGWSGHNQFFATFGRISAKSERLGDQLAAVAERAGKQNILYLELMETLVLPELFPLIAGVKMTGNLADDYQTLMNGKFGTALGELTQKIQLQVGIAKQKKDDLLGCRSGEPMAGCDVEIRFLHQVIREFEPAMVYAQIILGWSVMENIPDVVGLNLVAPEDGFRALRDYTQHMRMIDYLYTERGPQNISLHAGELAMGLVRPKQLKFHIREAIEIGHAKRIGHGVAIKFEENSEQLLKKMADDDILVEINLTSNAVILGIEGTEHPLSLYRDQDVPYTISTDDEGVSRIDMTHEYIRLATTYRVPYFELRQVSRNSLTYSFLDGDSLWSSADCEADVRAVQPAGPTCQKVLDASDKARLQWTLEQKFRDFENSLKILERKRNSFN